MEELKWVQQYIIASYPMLETNILSSSDALHVWKNKTDQKGLKFLINFHLIFKVSNDDTIIANLITFNGKTVDSLLCRRQDEEPPDNMKLFLNEFASDHDLCQGVDRFHINPDEEHLLEYLNDSIIARNIRCRFKLKSNQDDLFCDECAKLKLVKTEPLAITKIEDDEIRDIKNVLALSITEEPDNGDEYYDGDNNYGDEMEDDDADEANCNWGVTLYKNDEPMRHYGPPASAKPKSESPRKYQRTYSEPRKTRVSKGTKCRPIIEPVDPNEERKRRVERIKQMRLKKLGGRPTDAEREKANQLVKIKCKVCLRVYKSKSSFEDDQSKHAQYFELTGPMMCPLCHEQVERMEVTAHFDEKHSESQPTTCCIGCQLVITNTDGALRKHIVKFHHNQNICEVRMNFAYFNFHTDCNGMNLSLSRLVAKSSQI